MTQTASTYRLGQLDLPNVNSLLRQVQTDMNAALTMRVKLNAVDAKIKALDANVASAQNTANAALAAANPAPVFDMPDATNLTATISHKSDVQLKWKAPPYLPSDFDHYEIYYGTASQFTTSTTSLAIQTGSRDFFVAHSLTLNTGDTVAAQDVANSANWMVGTVYSYNGSTGELLIDVSAISGIGTISSWNILKYSETFVTETKASQFLITDPAVGINTYRVTTVNIYGNPDFNPPYVTIETPSPTDVTNLTATVTKKRDLQLKWTPPTLRKGFDAYEIRVGTDWATGTYAGHTKQPQYLLTDPTPGVNTYWVGVLDLAGNYSPSPEGVVATVPALPDVTNLSAAITHKTDVLLKWTPPSPKPTGFNSYEIRVGASWAAGTYVADTKSPQYLFTDPTPGTQTYFVGLLDNAGNYDATPPSVTITTPSPTDVTNLTATVTNKRDLQLKWTPPTLPTGFSAYEIRVGSSWALATYVAHTKSPQYLFTDPAPGTNTYWVGVEDSSGNYGPVPLSVVATVPALPDVTSLAATITKKSDILLTWRAPSSPLPTGFSTYEVRIGASWAAGTLVHQTKQLQLLITDPPAGTNTYWVGVLDHAGNYDPTPPSVSANVAYMPDVTGLTAVLTTKSDVQLKWTALSPRPADFSDYEIRQGASWAAGTFVDKTKQAKYLLTSPAPGTTTYWVGVMSISGNYDQTPPSVTIIVPAPDDVTGLTAAITNKRDIQLKWTKPTNLPTGFSAYEIRSAASNVGWASATFVNHTKVANYLITDPTPGTTYYWVAVLDLSGNYSVAPPYVTATLAYMPDVAGLTATVTKKKDVQLKWTPLSPLPIGFADYEIRSAATNVGWASATFLHKTKQAQLLITDPAVGTVYYWVGVMDLAGNYDQTPPYVTGSLSAGFVLGALAALDAIPLNTSGGGGSGYITSSGGTALKDNDVITSQGTAANIANQGALAVQSTQGLGFSDLRIGTYSGESQSSTISIAFGPGMVLMDSAGATLSLSSGVSGQTISASVIGAGGFDVAPPTSPVGPYYYFLYEIYDPATQTAAAMASQSSSNPAMPSGYTYLRWIGAAVYQSNTEQFYSFVQNNYDCFYLSLLSFGSGVGNLAQFVPPIALASVVYVAPFVNWTSGNVGCVLSNDGTLKYTSVSVDYLGMSLVPGGPAWIPLTTSQTIYAIKVGGGVGTAEVQLLGFRLNL